MMKLALPLKTKFEYDFRKLQLSCGTMVLIKVTVTSLILKN